MELLYKVEELSGLMRKIRRISNISAVKIVTAFISLNNDIKDTLLGISEDNNITKENYEIYLSEDFAPLKRFEILEFLTSFAIVYITTNLHSKAYFISGDETLFAFGSANFTNNGFSNNLELMCRVDDIDENKVKEFFDYCKVNSVLVNENEKLLNIYKEMDTESDKIQDNEEIKELNLKIKELKKEIKQAKQRNIDDKYNYGNLEEYFFKEEDYEVFNKDNAIRRDSETNRKRDIVKNKLLEMNNDIKLDIIRRFNLHNHYREGNIISPVNARPNPEFSHNRLEWLGIRYGRPKVEIELLNVLNNDRDRDDIFGFQKYTCFQINLSYENVTPFFEVGIFHAVPNGAVDRMYLTEFLLSNNELNIKIIEELNKLKGQGLSWTAYNERTNETFEFDIDDRDPSEFKKWYLDNVIDGRYSSILFKIPPEDSRIKTKEEIESLIFSAFELLNPLYDLIIWKPNKR